jgi:hypothetical protein
MIKTRADYFIFKFFIIQELRRFVLEEQMKFAVDLRNKTFFYSPFIITSLLKKEQIRAYAVYLAVREKYFHLKLKSIFFLKSKKRYLLLIIYELLYIIKRSRKL